MKKFYLLLVMNLSLVGCQEWREAWSDCCENHKTFFKEYQFCIGDSCKERCCEYGCVNCLHGAWFPVEMFCACLLLGGYHPCCEDTLGVCFPQCCCQKTICWNDASETWCGLTECGREHCRGFSFCGIGIICPCVAALNRKLRHQP